MMYKIIKKVQTPYWFTTMDEYIGGTFESIKSDFYSIQLNCNGNHHWYPRESLKVVTNVKWFDVIFWIMIASGFLFIISVLTYNLILKGLTQ